MRLRRNHILAISCILAATLIYIIGSPFKRTYAAKWLEVCRLCGGNGNYYCQNCKNTGLVVCDGCKGSGTWICSGEDGKGPCDKGYYVCPSCHGDTYLRNGDGIIPPDAIPGSCGTCSGKGKIECWHCHGTGGGICDGCNGTGKSECVVGTCQVSRHYNWHCPNCKGTGYILTGNPMPPLENNDGIRNVPEEGDMVFTAEYNGAYYIYGSNQSGNVTSDDDMTKPTQNQDVTEPVTEPKPDRPDEVTTEANPGKQDKDLHPVDMSVLPSDRTTDYDLIVQEEGDASVNATVRIDIGKMSSDEQRIYTTLGEKELAGILSNVKDIVSSAEPGRSDKETDKTLESIAKTNGYDSLNDGRIYPLYFEGHQEIGFPVLVSVNIKEGELNGGTEIYVYHIADSGTIENLGKADVITYNDGSVKQIAFYTSSFSTFFTASKELELETDTDSKEPVITVGEKPSDAEGTNARNNASSVNYSFVIILVSVLVVGCLSMVMFLYVYKRKK